ncbi:DUF2690 domain-containing protein [Streptomyces nodosus]|uniref:DUF2690 domain-containing protein n=1 Tax=Streptomyces nodosus TaxID=40318 RepID=A0A5P2W0Z2_9ACTN|nr:DUF2690 domain-containing protein [Streptomyces nodosus]
MIHASYETGPAAAARTPLYRLRSCEDCDPLATAWENPLTVGSRTAADGTRLEIRLIPSCQAGWVRTWPTHGGFGIEVTSPDGRRDGHDHHDRRSARHGSAVLLLHASAGLPGR